jgi:hypothetical protein
MKDFIPYEQALALKELGFDESTYTWRQHGNGISGDVEGKRDYYNRKGDVYTALPLYQQAFRWFREKHGSLLLNDYGKIPHMTIIQNLMFEYGLLSYEEAELACLIKLIKIVKQKTMTQKIEPVYVTFEQAKKLKELGLVAKSDKYWVKMTKDEYTEMSDISLEDLDNSIGIGGNLVITKYQQWQIVEWLRVNHGIWIYVDYGKRTNSWYYNIQFLPTQTNHAERTLYKEGFISPQEAYSAAFDYILNNDLI